MSSDQTQNMLENMKRQVRQQRVEGKEERGREREIID